MTIYLTSDPHFGHELVAGLRGFETVNEHDDAVLDSFYRVLYATDDLWILGDLSGGGRRAEERALDLLRGVVRDTGVRLHLVEGNHDSCASIHRDGWKRQRRFLEVFESVHAFVRRRGPERAPVLLSHYPYEGDGPERGPERYGYARLKDTGAWLLHGHTHQTERVTGLRQIHVGWDAWRRPVVWDEIEKIIKRSEAVIALAEDIDGDTPPDQIVRTR